MNSMMHNDNGTMTFGSKIFNFHSSNCISNNIVCICIKRRKEEEEKKTNKKNKSRTRYLIFNQKHVNLSLSTLYMKSQVTQLESKSTSWILLILDVYNLISKNEARFFLLQNYHYSFSSF